MGGRGLRGGRVAAVGKGVGAPGAQVQGRLRRGARGGNDCGGAGCSSSGGMVAARARAARAAEARAGHRSGGTYTKGSLVPLVWSRSQIWSPTLILDVIGISQHLPERDRALSAHLCRRCTPGASAGFPGAPVLQSPPQRCQRHSDGGARAKPEGNRPRRSLQKASTNQRAAIAMLGEASYKRPEVLRPAARPVSAVAEWSRDLGSAASGRVLGFFSK